jgi:uncharacterized protein YjbI with pentapeptide repeats
VNPSGVDLTVAAALTAVKVTIVDVTTAALTRLKMNGANPVGANLSGEPVGRTCPTWT